MFGFITSISFLYAELLFPAYISPTFNSQYTGATNAHLIRGAYHFAHPGEGSGADQANFFLKHGGENSPSPQWCSCLTLY